MSYNSTVSVTIVKIFCRFENWMMSRHGPAGIPWILLPELRQDQIQTNSYCHSQHLCAVLLPLQLSAQIVERWKLLSLRADRTESQPTRPRPLPMATAMMILTVTEETICKGSMMEKTAGRKSGPGSSYLEPPRFSPADLRLPQRRLHAASLVYSCHAGLFTDRRLHQVRLQARDAAPAGPPRSGWACRARGRLGLLRAPLPVIRRRHAPPRPAGFAACRRDHGTSASPQPARRADSRVPRRRRRRYAGTLLVFAESAANSHRDGGGDAGGSPTRRCPAPRPPPARRQRVASSCLCRGGGRRLRFFLVRIIVRVAFRSSPRPSHPLAVRQPVEVVVAECSYRAARATEQQQQQQQQQQKHKNKNTTTAAAAAAATTTTTTQ